jgi:hypothetical protein
MASLNKCNTLQDSNLLECYAVSVVQELPDPEDGGSALLGKVGNYLPVDIAEHPTRSEASSAML